MLAGATARIIEIRGQVVLSMTMQTSGDHLKVGLAGRMDAASLDEINAWSVPTGIGQLQIDLSATVSAGASLGAMLAIEPFGERWDSDIHAAESISPARGNAR